jgi:hypothetical protein
MANNKNQVVYQDIDLKFQAHPLTGEVKPKLNADAIKQAVKNLCMTNQFEVLGRPDVYTDIPRTLFNLYSPSLSKIIRERISNIIDLYEPRATLNDITLNEYPDQNQLGISITYTPRNAVEAVTVEIFLERIR